MFRVRAIPILLLVLCAAPVAAQVEQGSPGPMPPPRPVPTMHATARSTVATFFGAFYEADASDLDRAAACLDLSGLPPTVRSIQGRELAVMLKHVMDRTRLVDLAEVPDEPGGDPWVFSSYEQGAIVVARQPSGRWLFTSDTVRQLPSMFAEVEGRDVVEGVGRSPDVLTPAMWLRSLAPPRLRERVFLLEGWQWLGLVVVVLFGVVVGRVFTFAVTGAMDQVLRKNLLPVDRELLSRAITPASTLLMVALWGVGALWLGLPANVLRVYHDAVVVVAVIAFAVTGYRLVDVVASMLERRASSTESRFDDLLIPLLRKTLKVVIVAIGLVTVAQNVGADVTGLIAGLGLGGLAFALAAKDTISNLFGSVTVLVDRPFEVGDWVKIGDVEGTVEEMGFRSTRIRTFYNSLITLPNSTLINAAVDNLGARSYRRWSTRLGVAYDTPPERIDAFCEGIRELIRRHPYTRKDYFHVYFNEYGAACLEILLYVFFTTPDWPTELRERHRLAIDILRLAHDLEVEFAFPTQTVYLRNESWTPPAPAGDGYPAATSAETERARQHARQMVWNTLDGRVPPPVRFEIPSSDDGGDAGE
jgi:MscS family membrane protein